MKDGANRPARIESSTTSVSCEGHRDYPPGSKAAQPISVAKSGSAIGSCCGIFAGAPWRKMNKSHPYSCGGRKTPFQHEPTEPNWELCSSSSPAQPANQILRFGCCINSHIKFESLLSIDRSKGGTVQNFPPANRILTQLDVATGSGSGRIADIFHCSHHSMPTFG